MTSAEARTGRSSLGQFWAMTTDEVLAYQEAVRIVASECAERVRRHGGTPREVAEVYDRVEVFCGRPMPIVRLD